MLFVLGELLARFLLSPRVFPAPPPRNMIDPYRPNPYIIQMRPYLYSHIPGATYIQARSYYRVKYEINSKGFRGPEVASQKQKGLKRLLIIGDSVVEGHGLEFTDTFSYLLNETFRQSGWEVVNAGVQGASPIYYAANVDRYISLQPDAVLIMIFENDIWDDRVREASYFKLGLPYLDDADRLLVQSPMKNILSASYFYIALRRIWRHFTLLPFEGIVAKNRSIMIINEDYKTTGRLKPFLVAPSLIDQQWNMSRTYLDYVVASFRQHNIRVLVTNLSIKSVRPDSEPPYHTYAHNLDNRVYAWAQEKQLPFLSLLPVMTQVFKEKQIFEVVIKNDGHPTRDTHAMIAAALYPWLLQHLNQLQ